MRALINCTVVPLAVAGGVASVWATPGQEAALFGSAWLLTLLCMGIITLLDAVEAAEQQQEEAR